MVENEKAASSLLVVGNDDFDFVLFKFAIDRAEIGERIWVVAIKPFEEVPEGIQQPCKDVLQLITFIYLSNLIDLLQHLNSIHKWEHLPNVIILKDFDQYCNLYALDEYDSRRTAFLSATLIDCLNFLTQKHGKGLLLISCKLEENKVELLMERLKVIHDMYFGDIIYSRGLKGADVLQKIKTMWQL